MNVIAGDLFTAVLDSGGQDGLVGTLTVQIENLDGTTELAPTTDGIVEVEPGIYSAVLVAPDAGEYLIIWFDGVNRAVEDLNVSISAFGTTHDPFITREDLTDKLGRDVTADDGALIAVDTACEMVRTLSEQTFNRGTTTEVFDGTGTDAILLPELPINSIGSVEVFNGSLTWTTAGSADYTLNRDGMLLATNTAGTSLVGCTWPRGRQNVRVTYDHGYEPADLPRDVRGVALAIAERLFIQGPAASEVSGDQQIRYGLNATDFSNGELRIIRKYRRCR